MSGLTSVPTGSSSPLRAQSFVWLSLIVAFGAGVVISSFTGRTVSKVRMATPAEDGDFVVPDLDAMSTLDTDAPPSQDIREANRVDPDKEDPGGGEGGIDGDVPVEPTPEVEVPSVGLSELDAASCYYLEFLPRMSVI